MLRKSYFVFCVFLLLIFLQNVITISAQTTPIERSNSQVRPFTDLTFEITIPEQIILPLQPIPINIKQSNRTNQAVLGYKSIGFGRMPIYLYVQKSGSDKKTVISEFTPLSSLTD